MAEEVLSGWIEDGDHVHVDLAPDGEGLIFETVKPEMTEPIEA